MRTTFHVLDLLQRQEGKRARGKEGKRRRRKQKGAPTDRRKIWEIQCNYFHALSHRRHTRIVIVKTYDDIECNLCTRY